MSLELLDLKKNYTMKYLSMSRKDSWILQTIVCYLLINISDDPSTDEKITGDPHRTIFVARLVSNFRVRNSYCQALFP